MRAALEPGRAKNVIFFLGDGLGTQEITAARYYQYGAAGRMNVDRLPFTGFQTTWSVKPGDAPPFLPDYDPDSASTGTMWAAGTKTIDERVSQGPSEALEAPGDNDLPTVLERAQAAGKRVGNVTTSEVTDATPAVLDSHTSRPAVSWAPAPMPSITAAIEWTAIADAVLYAFLATLFVTCCFTAGVTLTSGPGTPRPRGTRVALGATAFALCAAAVVFGIHVRLASR